MRRTWMRGFVSGIYHGVLRISDWILEPIDYIARVINGRQDFPPLRLRRYVGPLRSFESSGAEFSVYLKMICGVSTAERILDIGCGCGLIVPHIAPFLDRESKYIGIDIHKPSIEWCQRNISRLRPQFRFEHIDVSNSYYNPSGYFAAEQFEFPFADASFELILLKSVFTHMRPDEVNNYLRGIKRMLSDKAGRCLASFFLLNEEQRTLGMQGLNRPSFNFGDNHWRYMSEANPEAAVAFSEESARHLIAKNGLRIESVHYGTWSGRTDGFSFQDMVLFKRA